MQIIGILSLPFLFTCLLSYMGVMAWLTFRRENRRGLPQPKPEEPVRKKRRPIPRTRR
jgi:hypothetical protein